MSIESEVLSALGRQERNSQGEWSQHARNLSDGIKASGITSMLRGLQGAVQAGTNQNVAAILALASVTSAGLASVGLEVGRSNFYLSRIQDTLANPLSTQAEERYRRGVYATSQGWYTDALGEFDVSISFDKYQPLTHLRRSQVLIALGRDNEACDSLYLAAKYIGGDPRLNPMRAGIALLGAETAQSAGRLQDARSLLDWGTKVVPTCAELWLALAKLSGEPEHLVRALTIAPELIDIAMAGDIANLREAAESVRRDPGGPIEAMQEAVREAALLGEAIHLPSSTPQLLQFHGQWTATTSEEVLRLGDEVDEERTQAEAQRMHAVSRVDEARRRVESQDRPSIDRELKVYLAYSVAAVLVGLFCYSLEQTGTSASPSEGVWGPFLIAGLRLIAFVSLIFSIPAAVILTLVSGIAWARELARHEAERRRLTASVAAAELASVEERTPSVKSERSHQTGTLRRAIARSIPMRTLPDIR